MTDPLLADLNREQREAVTAPPGPTLVLAGAGSGKTRVITRRIGWRIRETDAAPESILAVTFTNKAAREMKERVAALGVRSVERAWVGTFHSIGLRLLRRYGSALDLPNDFPVLGEDDAKRVLSGIRKELGIESGLVTPNPLRAGVSRLKNALAAGAPPPVPRNPKDYAIRSIFQRYQEELPRLGAVDFDDLIILPRELLRASEPARAFMDRRAKVLLVDEYQDTSPLQNRLIREFAPGRDVFAVGDDDQSIYSFRGADFQNILRFENDFRDARILRLEQNYRSTEIILDAANAVIDRNRDRRGKRLRAVAGRGQPIRLLGFGREAEGARYAAGEIERLGAKRGQAAVLLRTRGQTRAFEEAFMAHRIPHRLIGGLRFYERKEVLDALAHLRIAANPADDIAFRRALGALRRGIGTASVDRIAALAAGRQASLLEAARALPQGALSRKAANGLREFLEVVERVRRAIPSGPAAAIRAAIRDSGLGAFLQENEPERYENLTSLEDAAAEYEIHNPEGTTGDFLDRVSLLSAEDFIGASDGDAPPVLVMTVHAAKGLEFDTVFLGGLWEGVFPHALSLEKEADIEEERRLFYVAVTRARTGLYLLATPGGTPWMRGPDKPSRFLAEIPRELLHVENKRGNRGPGFQRGDRVRHRRFGDGRIESVEADGARVIAVFRHHGRKRLVAAYANLERL